MPQVPFSNVIRPQWIRLTHVDGSFAGNLDPVRGIFMTVHRGGTAYFDMSAIIEEWYRTHGKLEANEAQK